MPKSAWDRFAKLRQKLAEIDVRIASVQRECRTHGMKTEVESDELRELYAERKGVLNEVRSVAVRYGVVLA